MNISIQHFLEKGIKKLEQYEKKFLNNPTDIASFVLGITDELHKLGLEIIKENFEFIDSEIQKDSKRKENWSVERHDMKCLTTSLGDVHFSKTYYKNKTTGDYEYLLDRMLEIDSHERMTEDAEAKMLEEVVQSSYKKAGEETSLQSSVSKQTVKNKIHDLEFPKYNVERDKKVVEYLYIDADEDHVHLQFKETKGDLENDEYNRKNNCVLSKIVYVYEGIEREAPESKRHRLIEPHYFCGVYDGAENKDLWDEVYEYLDSKYDLDKVKKIYLNADGGAWIKSGKNRIAGITYVLDEFHLQKYIFKATSHMLDSQDDAARAIKDAIKEGTKADFEAVMQDIYGYADTEACQKRITDTKKYILSNWMAAKIRLRDRKTIIGSSTECHVSHVLSSRMSSRPMGWSRLGCDKMSHLRAYYFNKGDMLELVRYQTKTLAKAAGAESDYEFLSFAKVKASEKNNNYAIGKYYDQLQVSVENDKIAKQFNLRRTIRNFL